MAAQVLLDYSASVEFAAAVLFLLLIGLLLVRGISRPAEKRSTSASWDASLTPKRELAAVLAILAVAALVRIVGWSTDVTAPYWFAQTTTVYVDRLLGQPVGELWRQLGSLFSSTHAGLLHHSAVMMPVAVGFQWLLGPSLNLALLVGAIFGLCAVLCAWGLGRAAESRSFGLLFAGFVAISPLQIVWSRMGGICIGSVPHVLLVLLLAFLAGKRGSLLLGALAGLATWATVYHYYAARPAIPLAFAAWLSGAGAGTARMRRALAAVAILVATMGAVYTVVRPPSFFGAFWPRAAGNVNWGEPTLMETVESTAGALRIELPRAVRAYFWENRATVRVRGWANPHQPSPSVRTWGMEAGGLVLVPVAALGVVGLVCCLATPRRRGHWLLFAAAGFAVPLLSTTTARRFIVFDAAWCALAAHGALAIADWRPLRALSARALAGLTAGCLFGLGAWSFSTIVLLNAVLPPNSATVIPFGESGYGDGRACLGCLRAARRWQEEIARNHMVVLFDTDMFRENRTMPGGLLLYGEIAALAAGRQRYFIPYYDLMENDDSLSLSGGQLFESGGDFSAYLAARIEEAKPAAIVWDFEQPTMWERSLADRLETAGGVRRILGAAELAMLPFRPVASSAPAPAEYGAFIIVTPWEKRGAAMAVFRDLAEAAAPRRNECARVEQIERSLSPAALVLLGVPAANEDQPPRWVLGGFDRVSLGEHRLLDIAPAGLGYEDRPNERVHILDRSGGYMAVDLATGTWTRDGDLGDRDVAPGCAVFLAGRWWGVDPATGSMFTSGDRNVELPKGRWMGVGRWSDRELILASADQELVVYDVTRRAVTRRFAAAVWPSRRFVFGECTPVLSGDGWVGTPNLLTRTLNVYDQWGTSLGTLRLEPAGDRGFFSVGAIGRHIAMGSFQYLQTAHLKIDPSCAPAAAGVGPLTTLHQYDSHGR